MLAVALAPVADAFGGRGGRGGGAAFGGRSPGFNQPGVRGGFKGGASHGFKGNPGFNSFAGGFGGGYNRSFPGLDGFGPGFKGFPGFRGFNGFNRGFNGDAGFGWFPWGSATTVYYGDYSGGWPAPYPAAAYAPNYYAPAPVYLAPPVYPSALAYPPQMGGSVSLTPVPPVPASVVAFPGGRYELRGDGVTAPYEWVWVPNARPVPPAPPTAPPATAMSEPAPAGPAPSASAPPARTQLYRWTDDQGVTHWTNRAEAVPTKYRKQARFNPDE
jgi:hypothetical protein